jgi:C1A family cysteine protease
MGDFMFKVLLGLLFCSSVSLAAQSTPVVVDMHGIAHGTGYVQGFPRDRTHRHFRMVPVDVPAAFDLRTLGFVSPVKDQGQCGSCWAHAITENLEDAILSAGKPGKVLAPQQLVSCYTGADGCDGGDMDAADYIVNPGLALESDYPYVGATTTCVSPLPTIAAQAKSWAYIGAPGTAPTTDDIKQALYQNQHSVFVTVAAGGDDWNGQGVMTDCSTTGVNHMVEIVGWTAAGQWIMRNSWGTDWGTQGFALMPYGCDEIATDVDSAAQVVL